MKRAPWLWVIFAALLTAGCIVQSTPSPQPTATLADTLRILDTPTPPAVSTSTPSSLTTAGGTFKRYAQPPLMTIDPAASYAATVRTNQGDMVIELLPSAAPATVNNFVFLANEGFYNGLIFHRVIPDFMIQGGDPTGTGAGGPGYRFGDEIDSSLVFDRAGILAMANGGPNTNGSQFFITTLATPHLNGLHTIFGRILQGQQVAEAISRVPADRDNRPSEPVIITTIEIAKTGGS